LGLILDNIILICKQAQTLISDHLRYFKRRLFSHLNHNNDKKTYQKITENYELNVWGFVNQQYTVNSYLKAHALLSENLRYTKSNESPVISSKSDSQSKLFENMF